MRQGQLPEDLDTARAAVALFSYVNGIIYQWLLVPDSYSLPSESEQLVEVCMDMLRFSPSPDSYTQVASCCLLYTSDAADEEDSVDLGGRRIIKKKKK